MRAEAHAGEMVCQPVFWRSVLKAGAGPTPASGTNLRRLMERNENDAPEDAPKDLDDKRLNLRLDYDIWT